MAGPTVGTIEDGYRFKGGNPSSQSSWEPVEAAGRDFLPNAPVTGDNRSEAAYWSKARSQADPSIAAAQSGVSSARRAEGLLARQEQQGQGTGGIYGVPFIGPVAGFLDPEIRELNAISAAAARQNRQPGEGAISDFDAAQFVAMTYGADKPIETNRALIQAQRVADDAAIQKREFQEWFFNEYRTTVGANEAWRAYAEKNPIFDPASQQDGTPRLNATRQNWRAFFTGDEGLMTQAERDARRSVEASGGPIGENGLPTYPTIAALTAGVREAPLDGSDGAGPNPPAGPQPGDVRVTAQPLAADDTPESLRAQGYVYDAERDTWSRSRREVAPEQRGWTPESAVAQRRAMSEGVVGGALRNIDAFGRGVANMASLGSSDEFAAGADALFGQGVGGSIPERFRNNIRVQRAVDRADGQDVPLARNIGNVLGAFAPSGGVALAMQAPRTARVVSNLARPAIAGALAGGAAGFGFAEGSVAERLPATGAGALGGAVIGRFAQPVVNAIAPRVVGGVRRAGNAIAGLARPSVPAVSATSPNAVAGVLERFGGRTRADAGAMTQRADEMEALGIAPTLADLTDDAGRGLIRAAATRQTPARQAAREFADQRAEGLQDGVSRQARRTISDDARSPDQIRAEVSARRAQEGERAFGAVRNEALTPEPQIVEALRSPAGRAAVEDAAVRAANRGDIETANGLRQLGIDALDNPAGVQMTVGMADRIARTLNGLGEARRGTAMAPGDNDAAASFFSLAEALRGSARRQVPGYDDALKAYGDDSRLIEAAGVGERFMTMEADQFGAAVSRLDPDARAIAQAAARRAVERSASTQGNAPGVALRLAGGREQGMRSAALLDDPTAMQTGMRAERDAVMAAREVSPATGSPTARNAQDALVVAGDMAGGLRDVATGNLPGAFGRVVRRFQSRGFNDREAEALVMAAIDPARTREIIDVLAQRGMTKREARNTVRAIQRTNAQFMAGQGE